MKSGRDLSSQASKLSNLTLPNLSPEPACGIVVDDKERRALIYEAIMLLKD